MNDIQPITLPGIDPRRPLVIAGPCSAETEEQVLDTARSLAAEGIRICRAGLWKPRTKPGGFEGVGEAGIAWLQRVKRETGMYTSTEVATREHVATALKGGVDLLWIGARTAANPFAMQEIADALRGTDVPVLVKNPVSPDLELWIGAIERIYNAGIRRIGAIHRGFTSIDKSLYRNHPMWAIPIELHRRLPRLPIFCDPSHIGGKRELIAPLSQQAMDLGFDGLIIEAHCSPDCAWSDKAQQVTPEALAYIIRNLVIRDESITTESHRTVQKGAQHARPANAALRGAAGPPRRAGRADGHGPRVHAHRPAGHPRGVDPPADGGAGEIDFPASPDTKGSRPPGAFSGFCRHPAKAPCAS